MLRVVSFYYHAKCPFAECRYSYSGVYCFAECRYNECHLLRFVHFIITLSVVILDVIILITIHTECHFYGVIMLIVSMLNVNDT
jgi:hypothetical protein